MVRTVDTLSVLIVDEQRESRTLVRDMLITTGVMNVREAANAEAALHQLMLEDSDLVLVELGMNPKAGLETIKSIRDPKRSKRPKVPISVVTGTTDRRIVFAARDAGVNDFIAKPVSADALHKRLERLIRNPQEFVESTAYFGPDRRRREVDTGQERRGEEG